MLPLHLLLGGAGQVLGLGETFEPVVYVYDAATGEEVAKCGAPSGAGFANDVVVVDGKAYSTDSLVNTILEIDVDAALNGECDVRELALPVDAFFEAEGFRANGIVAYGDGLIIA